MVGFVRDFVVAGMLAVSALGSAFFLSEVTTDETGWKRTRGNEILEGARPDPLEMYDYRMERIASEEFQKLFERAQSLAAGEPKRVSDLQIAREQAAAKRAEECRAPSELERRRQCKSGIRHRNPGEVAKSATEFEIDFVAGRCFYAQTRREVRLNGCVG